MLRRALVLIFGSLLPARAAQCPPDAAPFTAPSAISDAEQLKYADLFTVVYHPTYKVIKYNPTQGKFQSGWPNPSLRNQRIPDLVLYQCGTTQPTSSYNDVSDDAWFFSVPIDKAALPWTGSLHFFELLSVTEAINAIDMTYISSPCAQLLEECTPGIHAANSGAAWQTAAQNSEAVFTDSWGTGASNTTRDVVFDVSRDAGILPRAEWIKFLALFFNLEVAAGQAFSKIESDYLSLRAEGTRLQEAAATTPNVAWVAWQGCADAACDGVAAGQWRQKADGNWCRCGSAYLIYNSHFRRDITQDAGARLLTMPAQEGPGCRFLTNSDGSQTYECQSEGLDHYLQLLAQADMIVDETYVVNHGPYTLDDFVGTFASPNLTDLSMQAKLNSAVYRIDGSVSDARDTGGQVGSNWFEAMPVQPQQLLSDVMHAVWREAFNGPCSLTYLRNLYAAQARDPLEHSDCPLYDAAGTHDCAGIHDYEHQIHQCAIPPQVGDSSDGDNTLALGLGLGLGIPVILLAAGAVGYCYCKSSKKGAAQSPTSPPSSGGGAFVVGTPVDPATGEKV